MEQIMEKKKWGDCGGGVGRAFGFCGRPMTD